MERPGVTAWCRWLVRAAFGALMAFVYVVCSFGIDSDHSLCRAMMNNLFLAYLPVEMALHVSSAHPAFVFWGMVAAWTIFYPNAPYVLTDYFHLAHVDPYIPVMEGGRRLRILRPDLRIWLTFTVLSLSALVSALFGTWSLDHVVRAVQVRIRRRGAAWLLALVTLFAALSSAGIYLGRFPRLHSIHLLTRPGHAVGQMASSCSLNMVEFIAMLTLLQVVLWGCLRLLRTLEAERGRLRSP